MKNRIPSEQELQLQRDKGILFRQWPNFKDQGDMLIQSRGALRALIE